MASLHDLRMGDIIVAPSYFTPFFSREQLIEENPRDVFGYSSALFL